MKIFGAILLLTLSTSVMAAGDDIPLNELGFLDAIQRLDPTKIVEQFGEPSRDIEVRNKDTGELIGRIWYFQYLNTTEDGDYYKGTELDIVGDHVVTVVFTNTELGSSDAVAASNSMECPQTC